MPTFGLAERSHLRVSRMPPKVWGRSAKLECKRIRLLNRAMPRPSSSARSQTSSQRSGPAARPGQRASKNDVSSRAKATEPSRKDGLGGRRAATAPADARRAAFGYSFRDPNLLNLALTHSSLAYENQRDGHHLLHNDNERLEFIGDAVVGLIVAEALYRRFPALQEGELTRMRATLVSRRNLADVAQRIGLGPMLRLGRGEEHSGGQYKPALLANALEAVIAAMYLDGGLEPASTFIARHIVQPAEPRLTNLIESHDSLPGATGDYKSALQEKLQASGSGQPRYVLAQESGPDHQKRFRIEVRIDAPDGSTVRLSEAEGTTKKQAQQEGARLALAALSNGGVHSSGTATEQGGQ